MMSFVGLILFLTKIEKYIFAFSVCLVLSIAISNFIGSKIIDFQREKVFEDGNRIAQALEQYYKDNNRYPAQLSELVPKCCLDDNRERCGYR
jgi:Tfp pilus assembly protein PilE